MLCFLSSLIYPNLIPKAPYEESKSANMGVPKIRTHDNNNETHNFFSSWICMKIFKLEAKSPTQSCTGCPKSALGWDKMNFCITLLYMGIRKVGFLPTYYDLTVGMVGTNRYFWNWFSHQNADAAALNPSSSSTGTLREAAKKGLATINFF